MMRICAIFFLLLVICGRAVAGVNIELDVVFRDSTKQCQFLYILVPNAEGNNDTLAVFDTLSFNKQSRISLFYTAPSDRKNLISIVDTSGLHLESRPFKVSSEQTTFTVFIKKHQVKVVNKDYLYPQKNEDKQSYFFFLLIFFIVKILIATIYIFISKLPKRLISIAAGTFLLSAFIDWFLPYNYFYRLLITALVEFLLIFLVGRKSIPWFRAILLVILVNVVGFGIIVTAYLLYVFW